MPDSILQQKIFPWDGSFDATKHPLLISPKDVVESQNIVYTTYSTKKKRPGITPAFPKRFPGNRRIIQGVDFWRLGTQKVVIYEGRNFYAINPSSGSYDDISLTFSVPTNVGVSFNKFQGLLVSCFNDGVTSPKGWVGSGAMFDLDPTAPNAAFSRVWLNRLWMPDPSVPGRILFSQTGNVQFTGGDSGALDLDPNDGDPDGITSIFPPFFNSQGSLGSLYITKRFSIYKISLVIIGNAQAFSVTKISDGIGCISHNAVAASSNHIFFPSDEGIHYLSNTDKISGIESEQLSEEIQPIWDDQTNFKRSQYMSGVYDRRLQSYILLYPSTSNSYSNEAWGYSTKVGKWYRWREYNQTCAFQYVNAVTRRVETMVGSATGDLGVIDQNSKKDYDKPIDISFRSGIIAPGGTPDDQFAYIFITPIFVPQISGSFTLTYKIDGRVIERLVFDMQPVVSGDLLGIDFVLGESVLGGLPQVKIDRRRMKGYGMLYEIFIDHQGIGDEFDGFELLGLMLEVDRTSKRVGPTGA